MTGNAYWPYAPPDSAANVVALATEHSPDLAELVSALAMHRICRDNAIAILASAQATFDLEHLEEIEEIKTERAAVDLLEVELREAALTTYAATGDKKPTPGVEIKLFEVLAFYTGGIKFDPTDDYLIKHMALERKRHDWLKVDRPKLERDVKHLLAGGEYFSGIEIVQEPRVTVAKDLAKAVEA